MESKKYRDSRKKAFVLNYQEVETAMRFFENEELGQLMRAVFSYEMYGERGEFKKREMEILFFTFCSALDGYLAKYLETCERNRKNRNAAKTKEEQNG